MNLIIVDENLYILHENTKRPELYTFLEDYTLPANIGTLFLNTFVEFSAKDFDIYRSEQIFICDTIERYNNYGC
jgi:hypothetical protein